MQERDRSKRSMVFYFDWFDNFDGLEPEEITDLLTAIRVYAQYGEHIDGINRVAARILKTMESRIDADFESWLKTTNAKRENGLKGGRPPKKGRIERNLQEPTRFLKNLVAPNSPYNNLQEPVYEYDTEYDNDSVSEYDSETESEKEKVFEEDIGKGVQGETLEENPTPPIGPPLLTNFKHVTPVTARTQNGLPSPPSGCEISRREQVHDERAGG